MHSQKCTVWCAAWETNDFKLGDMWFQDDGATYCTVSTWTRCHWLVAEISRSNPIRFFLQGSLEEKVYVNRLITVPIDEIEQHVSGNITKNFVKMAANVNRAVQGNSLTCISYITFSESNQGKLITVKST